MGDTLTIIYSCLPAEAADPEEVARLSREQRSSPSARDKYPPLPWPMEALPGTTWRNVKTGLPLRVEAIGIDRWGKSMLIAADTVNYGFSDLGLWYQGRFYIEHWVRVDHLPATSQLAWYQFEIKHRRKELIRINITPWYQRQAEEDLAIAISQMREFALQHDLTNPLDVQPVRSFLSPAPPVRPKLRLSGICLRMDELNKSSVEAVSKMLISAKEAVELVVPCRSIGRAGSHLSIAEDYLNAIFLGETLAGMSKAIEADVGGGEVRFRFLPQDIDGAVKLLLKLGPIYDEDLWQEDDPWEDDAFAEIWSEIDDFAATLEERKLHIPELGDMYLANYVGGEYDLPEETVEELHQKFPEREYGFWRSFASDYIGFNLYVSRTAWIVPSNYDIAIPLTAYGGYEEGIPDMLEATPLSLGNLLPVVLNQVTIVRYPLDAITNAQKCAEALWLRPLTPDNLNVASVIRRLALGESVDEVFPGSPHVNTSVTRVFLSRDANLLLATDAIAQYILFGDSLPRVSEGALSIISTVMGNVINLTGGPAHISCPWENLDDDLFEQLCYDVICYVYHPGKIHKMGKSRSRDGGRDIEFEVPPRLGKAAVKWIAQCKLIGKGGSLTGSRLQISDTVDQYQAGGFCVMTSGMIDSTLHDKLEAIGRNRGIETARWSVMELERFLAQYPMLYQRYFARNGSGSDER